MQFITWNANTHLCRVRDILNWFTIKEFGECLLTIDRWYKVRNAETKSFIKTSVCDNTNLLDACTYKSQKWIQVKHTYIIGTQEDMAGAGRGGLRRRRRGEVRCEQRLHLTVTEWVSGEAVGDGNARCGGGCGSDAVHECRRRTATTTRTVNGSCEGSRRGLARDGREGCAPAAIRTARRVKESAADRLTQLQRHVLSARRRWRGRDGAARSCSCSCSRCCCCSTRLIGLGIWRLGMQGFARRSRAEERIVVAAVETRFEIPGLFLNRFYFIHEREY